MSAKTDGAKQLGRFLAGGLLRVIAGSELEIHTIAEEMLRDEMEDASVLLVSLPPAERKVWRARAKAALRGLDRVVAEASRSGG